MNAAASVGSGDSVRLFCALTLPGPVLDRLVAWQALIPPGSFRLVSGEEALRAWRPEGGGWEKLFCVECGSAVMSRNPEDRERMSIRMGTFDTDPGIRPSVRQFTAYAASWEEIPDDGLPRHAESAHAD